MCGFPRSELTGRVAHGDNDDGTVFLVNAIDGGVVFDEELTVALSGIRAGFPLRAAARHGIQRENFLRNGIVEPALLPLSAPESSVTMNFNMTTLVGKNIGRLSLMGQGAGKYPTGSSLVQDMLDIKCNAIGP